MITRRSFLGALIAAPAIVRAESLMKIFVPKRDLILPIVNGGTGSTLTPHLTKSSGFVYHRPSVAAYNEVSKIISFTAVEQGYRTLEEHDAYCATLTPSLSTGPFRIEKPTEFDFFSPYELALKAKRNGRAYA